MLSCAALLVASGSAAAEELAWQSCQTTQIEVGELRALFRDNSRSPEVLSGVDSLYNLAHAPDFDAFDPDSQGASAGLNFEHIISGHRGPHNKFTPRHGSYSLERAAISRKPGSRV